MKLKLKQLWDSTEPLSILVTQEIEAKGKYWIAKQANKIEAEIQNIDARRQELIKKYGKASDNGFVIKDDPKAFKKFSDEFNALLKEEIDLDIQTIKFKYIENIKLAPAVLMKLDYLIDEPEPDEDK